MQTSYSDQPPRKTLLLVDDEPANLHILRQILQHDYHLLFAIDGKQALVLSKTQKPDLILMDVMLPDITGYEICQELKQNPGTKRIPVIFISAMSEAIDEAYGFEVGAVDYITKPASPTIVRARVGIHLSLLQNGELQETRLQIIHKLGRAAEYKANETGLHVIRLSHYARLLATAAGLSELAAEKIFQAAPMHDIGKIGIPDNILLKPGKLTDAEWTVVRKHPEIGAQIIGEHDSALLKAASVIALSHHERWDGSGYPNALKGKDIPLEGRIVAIVDVFDALTSERPYENAWSVPEAVGYLEKEAGRQFDPELTELFISALPQALEIKQCWAEGNLPQRNHA